MEEPYSEKPDKGQLLIPETMQESETEKQQTPAIWQDQPTNSVLLPVAACDVCGLPVWTKKRGVYYYYGIPAPFVSVPPRAA